MMMWDLKRLCALMIVLAVPIAAQAQHQGDIWVGVVGEGGDEQLAISPYGFVPVDNYHSLSPVSGLFNGWSDNNPGFDRITVSQPEFDLSPMEPGCDVYLEVVEMDPAFRVIDNGFRILENPGDRTYLGDHTMHVHPTWHINSDDPEFDSGLCVWHGTFVLVDMGSTGYADSELFTLTVTNIPTEEADGDFDGSGQVDIDDYLALFECMSGPSERPSPDDPSITTCEVECVNAFDFDGDRDVDLVDVGEFQLLF